MLDYQHFDFNEKFKINKNAFQFVTEVYLEYLQAKKLHLLKFNEQKKAVKLEVLVNLRKKMNDKELFRNIVHLIDFLITLPEADNELVYDEFKKIEDKNKGEHMVGFLESRGIQKGIIEGENRGIIKGKIEGKIETLLLILESKGLLSNNVKTLISETKYLDKIELALKDFLKNQSVENIIKILEN